MYAEESANKFKEEFKLKDFDRHGYIRIFDIEFDRESDRKKAKGIRRDFEEIGNQVHLRFIQWYKERKYTKKELFKGRLSLKKLNPILADYRKSFLYIITL